ncbi:MAG: type III pantothenate kinase [Planctomycetota bacterium]
MILFADCGNTAVKFALGSSRVRMLPDPQLFDQWLNNRVAEELILLPGAAHASNVVRQWWTKTVRIVGTDIALPECGQYPGMGLDRIVAGLATPPGSIVIDAGTATTLTVWGTDGRFAGGLIMPSPQAMIAGLSVRAPALPAPEPADSSARAAQHDTRGAIAAAAGIGHPAMVAACVERLRQETHLERVVITGGGADELVRSGRMPGMEQRPWLVLEGMEMLSKRS